MEAISIDTSGKDTKVDFESFLQLNRLLKGDYPDRNELVMFAVRLFDPQL